MTRFRAKIGLGCSTLKPRLGLSWCCLRRPRVSFAGQGEPCAKQPRLSSQIRVFSFLVCAMPWVCSFSICTCKMLRPKDAPHAPEADNAGDSHHFGACKYRLVCTARSDPGQLQLVLRTDAGFASGPCAKSTSVGFGSPRPPNALPTRIA